MKLVENVVGVNSQNHEIELHALPSHVARVSWPVIRDNEDLASILQDERGVVMFVTIKEQHTNAMPHEQTVQHKCVSNEILRSCQQMQPSFKTAVGLSLFSNNITMIISDDDAYDQMHDDYVEDDTTEWNDENYVGENDDCSEEDRGDDNDIRIVIMQLAIQNMPQLLS
ncbi:Uncharacterized protein TCM_027324 [Theobroma cacao]|uniref:Uncharacterized protein n=1 Tax=Theobroma cacao TaxID=3641 RepID=A0A061G7V7_THECC|nr:Uncharacterized protein TCM_027324 [Theobroma cacao]